MTRKYKWHNQWEVEKDVDVTFTLVEVEEGSNSNRCTDGGGGGSGGYAGDGVLVKDLTSIRHRREEERETLGFNGSAST
uniref:Uncharacterized protein n=1 Tax=Vespula pensylvanica TaxID=30213 RepID=A0A834UF02_VESPE|nr:hypothetical protein H0235_003469 [Vespula pensylvanica]